MGLFDQFLGKKKPKKEGEKSAYLPQKKAPTEIEFAHKFVERGGKFIYSENAESTAVYFNAILEENGWSRNNVLSKNPVLSSFFALSEPSDDIRAQVIHCEYLIANKGTILICNRQIEDKKLTELPNHLIIIAKTSDFKNDVSEAMTAINQKYKHNLPTNITTLSPHDPTKEKDFLSYGGQPKNLYLLVQEVHA